MCVSSEARGYHPILLGLALVSLLVLVPGCSLLGAKSEEPPVYKAPLIGDPVSIDPLYAQDANGLEIVRQVFDGLTDYDPKTMKTVPALAESWQPNEDASVWTFELREGVQFHDESEVHAEDFKFAWERVVDPVNASDGAYHFASIQGFAEMRAKKAAELSGVRAVGEHRLEVRLTGPNADFPAVVGHPVFSPVPAHLFEEPDGERRFRDRLVGTGPFRLGEWKREQFIILERWDGYLPVKAHLEKIIFSVYQNEDDAFEDFNRGVLHEAEIPLAELKRLLAGQGLKKCVKNGPMLGVYYYALSQARPPWKGAPALRQAAAQALDREQILARVEEHLEVSAATGLIPEGVPGFQAKASTVAYNRPQARRILAAQRRAGTPVTLTYSLDGQHNLAAEAAAESLAEVGFSPRLEASAWPTYLERISSGSLAMFHFGWIADYPTQDNFLFPAFYSKYAGRTNVTFYANAQTDADLLEARRTLDPKLRQAKYLEIQRKVLAEAPVVPMYFYKTKRVFQGCVPDDATREAQSKVHGYLRTALDSTPYERISLEEAAGHEE